MKSLTLLLVAIWLCACGQLGEMPRAELAEWWLDPDQVPLAADTRAINGVLKERGCASGKSPAGRILEPTIEYRTDSIVVTFAVLAAPGDCPANPEFPITIQLAESLGARVLLDGGVAPPRDATVVPNT